MMDADQPLETIMLRNPLRVQWIESEDDVVRGFRIAYRSKNRDGGRGFGTV